MMAGFAMRVIRLFSLAALLLGKLMVLIPQGLYVRNNGVKAFAEQLRLLQIEPEIIQELSRTYKELGQNKSWYSQSKKLSKVSVAIGGHFATDLVTQKYVRISIFTFEIIKLGLDNIVKEGVYYANII